MELTTVQPGLLAFTFLAAMLAPGESAIPLSLRHGLNSVLPLQAPPLGSYRYQFRSVQHSSRGGFGSDSNSTENPLNEIIMNLHKLESMFFGNNSFFHNFNFKHRKNRTRLAFPKWFNSWPDFDDSSSEEGDDEGTTDDPCGGGGFFDFSDFDSIIMEIKGEIDEFFNDMNSIFPSFHRGRNATDSSGEDWVDEFLDDIKKSFDKKHNNGDSKKDGENKPEEGEKELIEKMQEKPKEPIEKIQEQPKEPNENKESKKQEQPT